MPKVGPILMGMMNDASEPVAAGSPSSVPHTPHRAQLSQRQSEEEINTCFPLGPWPFVQYDWLSRAEKKRSNAERFLAASWPYCEGGVEGPRL